MNLKLVLLISSLFVIVQCYEESELPYNFKIKGFDEKIYFPATVAFALIVSQLIKLIFRKFLKLFITEEVIIYLLGISVGFAVKNSETLSKIQLELAVCSSNNLFLLYSCGVFLKKILFINFHNSFEIFMQTLVFVMAQLILNFLVYWLFIAYVMNISEDVLKLVVFFVLSVCRNPLGLIAYLTDSGFQHTRWVRILSMESTMTMALVLAMNWFFRRQTYSILEPPWFIVLTWMGHFCLTLVFGGIVGNITGFLMAMLNKETECVRMIYLAIPWLFEFLNDTIVVGSSSGFFIGLGLVWNIWKENVSIEEEKMFKTFWNLIESVFFSIIIFNLGLMFSLFSRIAGTVEDDKLGWVVYLKVIVLYLALLVGRIISLCISWPLMKKIGFINYKAGVLIAICTAHPAVTMLSTIRAIETGYIISQCDVVYIIGSMLFILSNFINSPLMPYANKLLTEKLYTLYCEYNMHLVSKHILEMVSIKLDILKRKQNIGPINWKQIRKHTIFMAVDKQILSKGVYSEDEENNTNISPLEGDPEFLLRHGRYRLLKTLRMYYKKQYERGLATPKVLRVLNTAINNAMYASVNKSIKIDYILNYFEQTSYIKRVILYLMNLKVYDIDQPRPNYLFGAVVYEIKQSYLYMVFIEISLLVDIYVNIYYVITLDVVIQPHIYYPIAISIVAFELIVELIANSRYGILNAVRKGLRKVTLLYICTFFYIILGAIIYGIVCTRLCTGLWYMVWVYIGLRLFRLAIFLVRAYFYLIPDAEQRIHYKLNNHLVFKYLLGKVFICGHEHILTVLASLVTNQRINSQIRAKIIRDASYVGYRMTSIVRANPWVEITVKTKDMARIILNSSLQDIEEMKTTGRIDINEYWLLIAGIEERIRILTKYDTPIHPPLAADLFENIPWISVLSLEDRNYLLKNIRSEFFYPEEVIFDVEDQIVGVYVVAMGTVRINFKPTRVILENLRMFGELPIIETCPTNHFNVDSTHYIVSKNTFGEMSLVTGRSSDCKMTAETLVFCHYIPKEFIQNLFKNDSTSHILKAEMWKHATVLMSYQLLVEFRGYITNREEIFALIRRGFIPDLNECKFFTVRYEMEEILLLQGVAMDMKNKELYCAPCCIPRNIEKLALPKSNMIPVVVRVETKLLIIPTPNAILGNMYEMYDESSASSRKTIVFKPDIRSSEMEMTYVSKTNFEKHGSTKSARKETHRDLLSRNKQTFSSKHRNN